MRKASHLTDTHKNKHKEKRMGRKQRFGREKNNSQESFQIIRVKGYYRKSFWKLQI